MPLDLYYFLPSPPCRAVLLAGKAVGVRLNLLEVCLLTGDKTPEFREVNPLQTVPTLNDDGFILYESRAIMRYLFNAYGKDDSLYPTDPRARAIVDQRLDFDAGTLIEKWRGCVRPVIHWNAKSISDDAKKQLKEIFQVLDGLIEECGGYCAGDHLTLADFSIIPIVSGAEGLELVDLSEMKHLSEWLARCKQEMPGYEETNGKGTDAFVQIVRSKMAV